MDLVLELKVSVDEGPELSSNPVLSLLSVDEGPEFSSNPVLSLL